MMSYSSLLSTLSLSLELIFFGFLLSSPTEIDSESPPVSSGVSSTINKVRLMVEIN